jgi:hypothetical protein
MSDAFGVPDVPVFLNDARPGLSSTVYRDGDVVGNTIFSALAH